MWTELQEPHLWIRWNDVLQQMLFPTSPMREPPTSIFLLRSLLMDLKRIEGTALGVWYSWFLMKQRNNNITQNRDVSYRVAIWTWRYSAVANRVSVYTYQKQTFRRTFLLHFTQLAKEHDWPKITKFSKPEKWQSFLPHRAKSYEAFLWKISSNRKLRLCSKSVPKLVYFYYESQSQKLGWSAELVSWRSN